MPLCITISQATATRACASISAGRRFRRITLDEYTKTEHDDAIAVIEWLAAQPWCNGAVGMFGISWGGFNLSSRRARPSSLKAIITLCAADDRYADDAHYMGGCLLTRTSSGARLFSCTTRCRQIRRSSAGVGARCGKNGLTMPSYSRGMDAPSASRRLLEAWLDMRELRCRRCPVYAIGGGLMATQTRCLVYSRV